MFTTSISNPESISSYSIIYSPIISAFAFNFLLFFVAQYKKDNSLVDIFWGFLLLIPNLVVIIIRN